jgi:hypothetical protein
MVRQSRLATHQLGIVRQQRHIGVHRRPDDAHRQVVENGRFRDRLRSGTVACAVNEPASDGDLVPLLVISDDHQ